MAQGEEKLYTLLLVGKTGVGKRATGNTIMGKKMFSSRMRFTAVTSDCEWKVHSHNGRKFKIMDSPGLFDPVKTQEETCTTITQAVAATHPGPNAILYVSSVGRYTEEEFETFQRLKCLLDESITQHMIIVFTGGDKLEDEGQTMQEVIDEGLPETLQQVLRECSSRYVLFNNRARDKQPQVEQLLSMVDQMMAENNHQLYTCPKYSDVGEEVEKEVAKRLQEKKNPYVANLEQQTEQDTKAEYDATLEEVQKEVAGKGSFFETVAVLR